MCLRRNISLSILHLVYTWSNTIRNKFPIGHSFSISSHVFCVFAAMPRRVKITRRSRSTIQSKRERERERENSQSGKALRVTDFGVCRRTTTTVKERRCTGTTDKGPGPGDSSRSAIIYLSLPVQLAPANESTIAGSSLSRGPSIFVNIAAHLSKLSAIQCRSFDRAFTPVRSPRDLIIQPDGLPCRSTPFSPFFFCFLVTVTLCS